MKKQYKSRSLKETKNGIMVVMMRIWPESKPVVYSREKENARRRKQIELGIIKVSGV